MKVNAEIKTCYKKMKNNHDWNSKSIQEYQVLILPNICVRDATIYSCFNDKSDEFHKVKLASDLQTDL